MRFYLFLLSENTQQRSSVIKTDQNDDQQQHNTKREYPISPCGTAVSTQRKLRRVKRSIE